LDGWKFRRQHQFGPCILDLFCSSLCLALEVDGGQHREARGVDSDTARTAYLETRGLTVVRLENATVFGDPEKVIATIREAIESLPSFRPSPRRSESAAGRGCG